MCLAEHVRGSDYETISIGTMKPISVTGVHANAAMAALTCLLHVLKDCTKLQALKLTFHLDVNETRQSMIWPPPPIPKAVMEVRFGLSSERLRGQHLSYMSTSALLWS